MTWFNNMKYNHYTKELQKDIQEPLIQTDVVSENIQRMVKKQDEIMQQMFDKHNVKSIEEVYVEESPIEGMLSIMKKSDKSIIGMISKEPIVDYDYTKEEYKATATYKYAIV